MILKKILKKVLLIGLLSLNFAWSIFPSNTDSNKPKKHQLSICAIFKNEKKYLKEWIEYHRVVGVDHFYLYDNNSKDRPIDVLRPYIKNGVVTLISWPDCMNEKEEEHTLLWSLCTQASAYENAIKLRAPAETEWLAFLDVEEFLVFPNEKNLKTVLEKYEGKSPGIKESAKCFDASSSLSMPGRRLLIETIERVKSNCCDRHKMTTKIIFKPALCHSFTWPPYECLFKDDQKPMEPPKTELSINRYQNRFKETLTYGKPRDKL